MDILKESATKFYELLQKEYVLTLGRKGKSIQIKIVFKEEDFKHLSGIHKLKDLDISQTKASQVFKKALNNNLKENDLMKSIYYDEIKDRLENLKSLETYLDKNMLAFKWDSKKSSFSKIIADYMLKENVAEKNKAYIFLKEKTSLFKENKIAKISEIKRENAISFFLSNNEYSSNQMSYTLLKSQKNDLITKSTTLLYDRNCKEKDTVIQSKANLQEKIKPTSDTMGYYEAEIARRQKQKQQLPHSEEKQAAKKLSIDNDQITVKSNVIEKHESLVKKPCINSSKSIDKILAECREKQQGKSDGAILNQKGKGR